MLLATACVSVSSGPEGNASCGVVARFDGRAYVGRGAWVEPVAGPLLGDAVLPPCDDTGNPFPGTSERIPVARIPGVEPDAAVVWSGARTIFVREGLAPIPAELQRFLRPVVCDASDGRIELSGTWLGILGSDGATELDMAPPYDIEIFAQEASPNSYERAYLSVRVRPSLGRPITRQDVRVSLWEAGTIEMTTRCTDSGLVATAVEAFPPVGG